MRALRGEMGSTRSANALVPGAEARRSGRTKRALENVLGDVTWGGRSAERPGLDEVRRGKREGRARRRGEAEPARRPFGNFAVRPRPFSAEHEQRRTRSIQLPVLLEPLQRSTALVAAAAPRPTRRALPSLSRSPAALSRRARHRARSGKRAFYLATRVFRPSPPVLLTGRCDPAGRVRGPPPPTLRRSPARSRYLPAAARLELEDLRASERARESQWKCPDGDGRVARCDDEHVGDEWARILSMPRVDEGRVEGEASCTRRTRRACEAGVASGRIERARWVRRGEGRRGRRSIERA